MQKKVSSNNCVNITLLKFRADSLLLLPTITPCLLGVFKPRRGGGVEIDLMLFNIAHFRGRGRES